MKLTTVFRKIIEAEPYNDISIFLNPYQTYEEIPVISRHSRWRYLQRHLGHEATTQFLINLAVFVMRTALIFSKQNRRDDIFYAITFTDFDDSSTSGFMVPNIFVHPNQAESRLLKMLGHKEPSTSMNSTTVANLFGACELSENYRLLESRFYDAASDEEIVRIYAVPTSCSEMIRSPEENVGPSVFTEL